MFSRQNSNSTLTFNHDTSTVSFSLAHTSNHASLRLSQDSYASHRVPNIDTPSPTYPPTNQKNTLDSTYKCSSNQKESSETAVYNAANHKHYSEPLYQNFASYSESFDSSYTTPTNHRDQLDTSETDSCSSNKSSKHSAYSCQQRQNGECSVQKSAPQYSADEYIEPDHELDGHQVYHN